jgi:hypothetical protein
VIVAGVVVLLVALAGSPVQVVSTQVADDACPSSAEVEQALASLIGPLAAPPAIRDVAKLERADGKLRVELVGSDGVVVAERLLERSGSCAEMGRMAAIVIASWESDVHPEFVRPPGEIPRVERRAAPTPPVMPPPAAAPTPPAAYEVGAGVSVAQADKPAAGGSIGAAWFPRGLGLGVSVLAAADAPRTIAVGAHEARWRRWTASLELAHRWGRSGFAVDAHGGPIVGRLATEGVDYDQNRSDAAVSFGATAGLRASWWAWRHAALWLDLRGSYFPRRESVYGMGTTLDETAVPSWGGIASIGVALGRGPRFP